MLSLLSISPLSSLFSFSLSLAFTLFLSFSLSLSHLLYFSLSLSLIYSLALPLSIFLSLPLHVNPSLPLSVSPLSLSISLHLNLSLSNEMKVKKDYLSIRVVLKTDSEMDLFIQPCGFPDSTIHMQGQIQFSRLVIYSCTTCKIKVFTIVVRIKL